MNSAKVWSATSDLRGGRPKPNPYSDLKKDFGGLGGLGDTCYLVDLSGLGGLGDTCYLVDLSGRGGLFDPIDLFHLGGLVYMVDIGCLGDLVKLAQCNAFKAAPVKDL